MNSVEIRRSAREFLAGKWGKAALITFIYGVISYLLSLVLNFIPIIGSLISSIISVPLAFGLLCSFIKLKRGEDVSCFSFFNDGFSNFSQVWFVQLRTLLKLLPFIVGMIVCYVLILVVSTASIIGGASAGIGVLSILAIICLFVISIAMIPKSMLYSLTQYILFDNPNKTALEIVEESEQLMRGNRANLFLLSLSFFGWALLACLTFGIGFFFLFPYMQFATIIFYEKLADKEDLSSSNTDEFNSDDYEIVGKNDETVITDLTNHDEE